MQRETGGVVAAGLASLLTSSVVATIPPRVSDATAVAAAREKHVDKLPIVRRFRDFRRSQFEKWHQTALGSTRCLLLYEACVSSKMLLPNLPRFAALQVRQGFLRIPHFDNFHALLSASARGPGI